MTFVWNDVWLKWRLFEKTFVWKDVCLKLRLFKSFLWTFFVQNFIYSKQLLFDPLLFFNNLYLTRSVQIPFFWIYHFCHDLQPFFSYVRFNWCHIWTNINFEQMLFDSLTNVFWTNVIQAKVTLVLWAGAFRKYAITKICWLSESRWKFRQPLRKNFLTVLIFVGTTINITILGAM